jgi:DNA-binding FadR family transcriptional regulator
MQMISKTSLAETAVQAIRAEILSRRWAVGEKLPNEATLCAMLSVSRGTVREAVRVLVSQGYLETRQGSGTYVLSVADAAGPLVMARRAGLRDQFETRLALDTEAARLAAIRHDAADIANLRVLLAARGPSGGAGFIARDLAFHRAVVAASRNSVLIGMYDFFATLIAETIAATLGADLPEPDAAAHAAIIDAIATGRPDAADAAVRALTAPVLSALDRLLLS